MIRAVLFDADNTLFEIRRFTKEADLAAMKILSEKCGISADVLYEDWRKIVSKLKKSKKPRLRHRKHSYSLLLKKHGLNEKLNEKMYEIFFQNLLKKIKTFDGVIDTLQDLKKLNLKLAIFTENFKEQIEKKLRVLKIKKYFDVIVTCDDAKIMKPSKKYFEIVKKRLKVPYEEMVAVGNYFENDLEIAKKIGIKTILIFSEDGKADFKVKNFSEILPIIKSLI